VAFVQDAAGRGLDRRVRVVDLATPNQSVELTPSGDSWLPQPNVSPDGNLVVWSHCDFQETSCQVLKAVRAGATWGAPEVVANPPGVPFLVDTDGSYIVYDLYDRSTQGSHLYIQAVAGGPVTQLAIPGTQSSARIDGGVIAFVAGTLSGVEYDVALYVIAT